MMMWGNRCALVAAALLLFAVGAFCSDEVKICEVECILPADYVNASRPDSIKLSVGKKLIVSLKGLPGAPVCHWIDPGNNPALKMIADHSTVIQSLSEADSGNYSLTCETESRNNFSHSFALRVVKERPSKPQLLLQNLNNRDMSPLFKCISDGSPNPTIEWFCLTGNKEKKLLDEYRGQSSISSADFDQTGAMCCATNDEGQECIQLFDYDLQNDLKENEVSNVTISPGEALVLRCRAKSVELSWGKDGKILNPSLLKCRNQDEMMCIEKDKHFGNVMLYVYIRPVNEAHSGTYTCRSSANKHKSVNVQVTGESFLDTRMDDQILTMKKNSCLTANVSYHPVLQQCYWEAPDGQTTKCIREQWVTKHRTVKLCAPLTSGVYRLHLEAGETRDTKNTTVCVADTPTFEFNRTNGFSCETVSPVPAKFIWESCNSSCQNDSFWKVIEENYHPGSDDLCNKKITSFVDQDKVQTRVYLRCCLENSLGFWCNSKEFISEWPKTSFSKGSQALDDSLLQLMKVSILILLLTLGLVIVVLTYYIKKKKPQYQPQLQMIQMVGPNDNDYIYINFKDFEYDEKWEFPRENLKLGKELGSGAFGMVLQATAYGINKPGVSQQVAVKMLKEKHQSVEKEALMSELKMLTHIGHHNNVVNLLGACTETGPIYLIFQYCCYGDLLNYLKKNSDYYHKSVTDAFNEDRFSNLYLNLQPKKNSSELMTLVDNYVPMRATTTKGQEDIALLALSSSHMEDPESFETEDDPNGELQALTFDDLLSFAFQVAKGMEFLSSKNCIHRDLAARNVLVTKSRLVKIGDFGLARDINNDSNYVVRGNVRLPVKWMAPESIFQGMYTMKSDVWAYGILLWEIFSLGVTPYPGMKVDPTFYSMIERGFKMECPYYANDSVYNIMLKCWALNPSDRPSFSKLVSFMCDQMTDREEKLYHNMLDQISSGYQTPSSIVDICSLEKQSEDKTATANEYCRANPPMESRAGQTEAVMDEEEPLKPSDAD